MASLATLERSTEKDAAALVDAALTCIERWGVTKTTLEDVAREAGCSRATVYRTFPGGKDALCRAVVDAELQRVLATIGDRLAHADDLGELIAGGIATAGQLFLGHPALRFVVDHEPALVLPRLAFGQMDGVLATVRDFAAPYLARFLPATDARRAAEWAARIFFSFALNPSPEVDLTDEESVRALVDRFVLPGLAPRQKPL